MSSPKISIVIPVYNVRPYLSECLDSILAQSEQDFQVILVDDGSTDGSSEICDKYSQADGRIIAIHQRNSGVSAARNNGMTAAEGKWITFVDSDDWLDESFLAAFSLNDDTELSVQGVRFVKYPELQEFKSIAFAEQTVNLQADMCKIRSNDLLSYGTVSCKAYRKDVIDRYAIRFDPSVSYHEDHIFFFQYISHIGTAELHEAVGYNYRITGSGTSLSSKKHPWDRLNSSSDKMLKELFALPFYETLPADYKRKISSYCFAPKVLACYNIYGQSFSRKERVGILRELFRDGKTVNETYFPDTVRNKVLKTALNFGFGATDMYLLTCERIRRLMKR